MNKKLVLLIVLFECNNFIVSSHEKTCDKIIASREMENYRLSLFVTPILTWAEQENQNVEDEKKDPKNFRNTALRLSRAVSEGSVIDSNCFGSSYDDLYAKIKASPRQALDMMQRVEDASKNRNVPSPVTPDSPLEKIACCCLIENIRDHINNT